MTTHRKADDEAAEPLLTIGAITTAATALLGLTTAFGLHLTDQQQQAILAVLAVAAPIVVAVWGRSKVYSPRTVARLVQQARRRPYT